MSSKSLENTLVLDDNYVAMDGATYTKFRNDLDCAYEAPVIRSTMSDTRVLSGSPPRLAHVENGILARSYPHVQSNSNTSGLLSAAPLQRHSLRGMYVCISLVGVLAVAGLGIALSNTKGSGGAAKRYEQHGSAHRDRATHC